MLLFKNDVVVNHRHADENKYIKGLLCSHIIPDLACVVGKYMPHDRPSLMRDFIDVIDNS